MGDRSERRVPSLKEIDAIPVEDAGRSPGGYPQHAGGGRDDGPPCSKPPFNFNDAIHWMEQYRGRLVKLSANRLEDGLPCKIERWVAVDGAATRPFSNPCNLFWL